MNELRQPSNMHVSLKWCLLKGEAQEDAFGRVGEVFTDSHTVMILWLELRSDLMLSEPSIHSALRVWKARRGINLVKM